MNNFKLKIRSFLNKPAILLIVGVGCLLFAFHIFILISSDTRQTIIIQNSILDGSKEEVLSTSEKKLNTFILITDSQTIEQDLPQAGVTFNNEVVSQEISGAWSWKNYLPVYGTWRLLQNREITPEYTIDEDQLSKTVQTIAEDLEIKPADASFSKNEDKVVIIPEIIGAKFDSSEIKTVITQALLENKTTAARVQGQPVEPAVSSAILEPLLSQYEKLAQTPPIVTIDEKEVLLTEDITSQLTTIDGSNIALNTNTVDTLTAEWNNQFGKPAGTTTVKYLDGVEISKVLGVSGRALNKQSVIDSFQAWFNNPENNTIQLKLVAVQPEIVESREYSAVNGQIQKAIDEWVSQNSGEYYVAFREIGGNNRIANYRSSTPLIMASTYKVFLGAVAYQMIENGELSASKIVYNGKNVIECIAGAITYSENECIIELGWYIGWDKIDQKIAAMGISGVKLNNYNADRSYNGDKTASADSLAKLLTYLQTGSLLNTSNTNQLLSYMKNQIYRDGIPAGVTGTVADKVGFLGALKHDMAIVSGGSTTYVLVILSNNSSWQKIASLSRSISDSL